MGKIYCLMTGGMYLHPRACDALFYTALDMITSKDRKRSFSVDEIEMSGEIRTHFEAVTLETISGIGFEATVERGPRTAVVRFIIRTRDLEDLDRAEWFLSGEGGKDVPLRQPLFN